MSGKVIALIFLIIVALVGIPATLYLVKTQQDARSRASEGTDLTGNLADQALDTPTPTPDLGLGGASSDTCTTPPQVTGVDAAFPSMANGSADFTQADCSWGQVTGATAYTVKITEKSSDTDAGTLKSTQDVPSTQTKLTFPVVQNKYYLCEVSAKNSCGTSGPTGAFTIFCPANGLGTSPTVAPTAPVPTAVPTTPPQPTLPPTGSSAPFVAVGAIGGMLVLIGGALLLL